MAANSAIRSLSFREVSPLYRRLHSFELEPGFAMKPHSHPYWHINLILEGSVTFSTDTTTVHVREGNVIIAPPEIPHSLYSKTGYRQLGIDMNPTDDTSGVYRMFESAAPPDIARVSIVDKRRFYLPDAYFNDYSPIHRVQAIHLMDELIIQTIEQLIGEHEETFKEQFIDLMGRERAFLLSVTEIASELHLSKTHLERLVRKNFDCSVKEYCDGIRFSILCQYLEQTTQSQKELCQLLGFYDESHLATFFKRRMGCSPGAYRKNAMRAV